MNIRQVWRMVSAALYRFSPRTRMTVAAIAEEIVERMKSCPREQTLVVMAGLSLAGKTTYVEKHRYFREFGQIRTRDIHDLLNHHLDFLRDDNTVKGPAYWSRQLLTEIVREKALRQALRQGIALVLDSCHLTQKKRDDRYRLAKQHGYRVIIVFVDCLWMTLLSRAAAADDRSVAQGGKRVWRDLIRQQVKVFEPPTSDEADQLIQFF